jgi:HSP20 family protein
MAGQRDKKSTQGEPGAGQAHAPAEHGRSEEALEGREGEGGLSPVDFWSWGGLPARRLFDEMDRMFDSMRRDFFGRLLEEPLRPARARAGELERTPVLDMRDTGTEIVVSAELPGVDPKDVEVQCTEDALTLRAESREEEAREGETYRSVSRFFRQIPLPKGLELDQAKASFKNGLLSIRLPRSPAEQSRVKRIPISTEAAEREAA